VLPPETSAHVQGLAIDVGPPEGAVRLAERGAAFGLCRTYANEAWHVEQVIEPGGACPTMHPDSSDGWRVGAADAAPATGGLSSAYRNETHPVLGSTTRIGDSDRRLRSAPRIGTRTGRGLVSDDLPPGYP